MPTPTEPCDAPNGMADTGTDKWSATGAGRRYATARFRSARARERDPRALHRLLAGLDLPSSARVLDVPCGSGRLAATIARHGRYTGADLSVSMLEGFSGPASRLRATAWQLPFSDAAFEVVVCCRLLHHVRENGDRRALLAELLRVARRAVVVSFWDRASLPEMRTRLGLRRARPRDTRVAISRAQLEATADELGARVVRTVHGFRFVSRQAYAVLHKPVTCRS